MANARAPFTCTSCRRAPGVDDLAGPNGVPWTWTVETEPPADDGDGDPSVRLLCAPCTREHSRSIEAQLDRDWW